MPGQSYMKVVELQEADMAVVIVMTVPMIRYSEATQQAAAKQLPGPGHKFN